MSTEVTVDTDQILNMFKDFDDKARKKVFRSTIRKAAGMLVRETRKRLTNEIGEAANHPNWWNGKKLKAGIYMKVSRDGKSAKVGINRDFRLKIFEVGTRNRRTAGTHRRGKRRVKAGLNRGRIRPMYFFRDTKAATEDAVFSGIEANLKKSIERINKKKYG